MKKLRLEVLFGGRDKLSPALKVIAGSSNAASKALKNTRDELKRLNDQQKQIDGYVKHKKATEESGNALKAVQKHIKSLRLQMNANPSEKLTKEFDKATKEAKKLKDAHTQNQTKLQQLRNELKQTGISTGSLADHQVELSRRINSANSSIDNQKKKLETLNRLQKTHGNYSGYARTAAMYGAGAVATGVGAMYTMQKPINESKRVDVEQNRIASLGLGKDATEEAIKYAKAMKTFGTSTLDNLTLVRDGVTAFADVHHAKIVAPMLSKMKFANEAMYGNEHGAENEKKFMDMLKVIEMRNGLKSEAAFKEQANIIQQVITATGGRVQPEEWLNVIKTGGIAAKGFDNKAFYYKLEPLVQEMGGHRVGTSMMSAYQNLYQGRTTQRAANNLAKFDLIGDMSKVKHNKTGDLSYLDIGAIKGAELFKKDQFAWMEQVLVPALNAKGITKEGDVVDAIGSIFSNRTASNLFAQMYMQREQIHKNAKLNEGAFNIEQLDTQARGSTTGKELEAKAKLHDAYLRFGQTILPVYTKAIELAAGAFQTFTGWMEKNPTLAKVLGVGLLVIASSLIAIGGALVVFSPLILSMLSLRLIMASTAASGTVLGKAFSKIPSVFGVVKTVFMGLGRSVLWLGRLFIANPILLAIAAVAAAAFLIYKNWEPIKGFFVDLWGTVKAIFNTAVTDISNLFQNIWGSMTAIIKGVWSGVKTAFQSGIDFIMGIIRSVDNTFANNPFLTFLMPFIGIPRLIIANWSSISAFFAQIWDAVYISVSTRTNAIISSIMTGFSNVSNFVTTVWSMVSGFISTIWQGITSTIAAKVNTVFSIVSIGFQIVQNYITGVWNSIKAGVSTAWQTLCNIFILISPLPYISSAFHSVLNFLSGLYGSMKILGSHIVQGLIEGIQSGFEKLKGVWSTINSYMPDFMRKKMDIHSPSRVMAALGGHVMGGIRVGLEQGFPDLKSQFSNVMDFLKPQFAHMPQNFDIAPVLPQFKLPELIQRLGIQPVLPQFKLPELIQRLGIQPVLPQFKLPELIQHLGIQPVLPQFKLPELIQRLGIQPVLPQFKLPELIQRLGIQPVLPQFKLPELIQRLGIQPVLPQFKLPELIQRLGIQPVLPQFKLPELIQRLGIEPVLPQFKLPELIQRLGIQPVLPQFKLPELIQRLGIQPVLPQFKLPELIQRLGIQPVLPQFKLPELIQRLGIQPVLPQFRLPELIQRLGIQPVLPQFKLPELIQRLGIQPVLPQFKLPELIQRLGIQPTVLSNTQPNLTEFTEKINVEPALAKISPVRQLSASSRGDVIVQGDTITIQIHAVPGQNLQQLQNMIENVLNKRDQQKQARARSSYLDQR
jgi:hypothetical protein